MAALDEERCYLDEVEAMLLEREAAKKPETEAMELNILAKLTKNFPCSKCGEVVGESKHKQCAACGEVVHASCAEGKLPVGYWFCADCAPGLKHGHADPALNIPLHNLIRGGSSYPEASEEMKQELKGTYSFVRSCLIKKTTDGDVIVPPPCLRADVIHKVHEELLHAGWERTYSVLRRSYWWPGMRTEVQAQCRACLSC